MTQEKVFTKHNVSECLNSEHTCYQVSATRYYYGNEVSFNYTNSLHGETFEFEVNGKTVYRLKNRASSLNGLVNALKLANQLVGRL